MALCCVCEQPHIGSEGFLVHETLAVAYKRTPELLSPADEFEYTTINDLLLKFKIRFVAGDVCYACFADIAKLHNAEKNRDVLLKHLRRWNTSMLCSKLSTFTQCLWFVDLRWGSSVPIVLIEEKEILIGFNKREFNISPVH